MTPLVPIVPPPPPPAFQPTPPSGTSPVSAIEREEEEEEAVDLVSQMVADDSPDRTPLYGVPALVLVAAVAASGLRRRSRRHPRVRPRPVYELTSSPRRQR